ncbi:15272_t:CDS:2, partial [Racocetra persica]
MEYSEIKDTDYNETKDVNYNEIDDVDYNSLEDTNYNEIEDIEYNDLEDAKYLPTSSKGIVICYNIENCESYEAVFENINNLIKNSNHTEVDISKDFIQQNDKISLLQKTKEAKTYT